MKTIVMQDGKATVGTARKVAHGGSFRWEVRREDGYAASGDTLEEAADNAGSRGTK